MVDHMPAIPSAPLTDETYVLVGGPAGADTFSFGGAYVVVGRAGTVIITEAGDALDKSGVWSADEVRLLGPAPEPVMERLMGRPSARGSGDTSLPIHLMVRTDKGFLHLGTGQVTRAATVIRPGCTDPELSCCLLRPDTLLSRAMLDQVRPSPAAVDLPGVDWLGEVNGDRAAALEQFITGWYPAGAADRQSVQVPQPSSMLPGGLKQLFRLAEQRPGVLGVQNRLLTDLVTTTDHQGEMRVFGEENQGGFFWALLWTLDDPETDPTVWFREYNEPPIAEQEPLSGFLIQFSLFEAAMGAEYVAIPHHLAVQQIAELTEGLRPVPLRPFWPWAPTRFYVAPGLVLYVSDEGEGKFSTWAGATHRAALAPLADADIKWSSFDG